MEEMRKVIMVKLLAYYLPQFHEIPENNKFWGKGFTEWTNVRKAKPLYQNHYQPRVPYQENYYDLSNPQVMIEQMKLARKYGIYGFCFYHYWFGNGKVLLDKPLENILKTPEADLPFCISWANEDWVKTWHGAGGENRLLIKLEYGQEDEWNRHIEWLLRFFKDDRYIKKDNKPVLLLYNASIIPNRNKMLALWDKRVKEEGFDGLWIVAMKRLETDNTRLTGVSANVSFEPRCAKMQMIQSSNCWFRYKIKNGEKLSKIPILRHIIYARFDYDEANQIIINRKHKKNEYRGVFTDYDDTPRRTKWAHMYKGATPAKFQKYLEANIQKSIEEGNEFLFINAWNEWGEGAYLEPDERYGYAYLNAVKRVVQKYRKSQDR